METVGVAIPSIPPRSKLLMRAIESVQKQTRPVDQMSVVVDVTKRGEGPTRNQALQAMSTDWTCFLDDDELKPGHVEKLLACAHETDADVVYPWFDVIDGTDPFPEYFDRPWNPDEFHSFPITVLGRTSVLQQASFPPPTPDDPNWVGGDYPYWMELNSAGAKIVHLPERTWLWHHDSGNTSGVPWWWDS